MRVKRISLDTVKEAGVSHLLTEDMQDGRSVLGVWLINPLRNNWRDI
ncbi:MAG: hypothetical protein ACYDD9_08110 [Acidithiobacillus sp.]